MSRCVRGVTLMFLVLAWMGMACLASLGSSPVPGVPASPAPAAPRSGGASAAPVDLTRPPSGLPVPEPSGTPLHPLGGERLSLADCLEFARQHHPRLKEKQAAYDQCLAQVMQSRAMYSDAFKFSIGRSQAYTFNAGQRAPVVSPVSNTTINLQPLLNFAYPLADGGKRRFSIERDGQLLVASACDLRTEWRKLSLDIQTDYLSVLYERDQLLVQQENGQRAQEVLDEAEGQYRAGRKSRVDVLRARTEVTKSQATYFQQMAALNKAWWVLEATVGCPMNPLARIDDLYSVVPSPPLPPPERIIQVTCANRSDLLKAVYQVEAQKKQIQVNESDTRATVESRLDYGFTGPDNPLYNYWMASISLNIPLSAWGKTRASNAQARALISGYREGADSLRLEIMGELGSRYVEYNSAAVQVDLYGKATKQAQEAYDTSMQRYRSGLADFTEVSQTRQEMISARSSLVAAQRDRKQAEMRLLSTMERLP